MRPLAQFVLVVAACLLVGTTADAQTINACVMKSGILKVLYDGAECLPQETPITLGQPEQPAVETVRVFDGDGRDIGAFVDVRFRGVPSIPSPVPWAILLSDVGATVLVDPETGLPVFSIIRFSELDCMGRGFGTLKWSNMLIPDARSEDSWLIGSKTEVTSPVTRSFLGTDGRCNSSQQPEPPLSSVTIEEFNQDLGITFPLPLPLWVGSSSDSP
jgi:hypothetical protein